MDWTPCRPSIEAIDPDDIRARFADGTPAMIERRLGDGRLTYFPFYLGHSYHRAGDHRAHMHHDVLQGMQINTLDFVAPLVEAAGAPIAATDHPLVNARLIESAHGAAVILINTTGESSLERIRVRVQYTGANTVESLYQGRLDASQNGQFLEFDLPMNLTDIVRLLP